MLTGTGFPKNVTFYLAQQNKIEHFIHSGLRRPMQMGHRQAWVWQDEWYGLAIDDIRQLEEETQRLLAKKMKTLSDHVFSNTLSDRESDQEYGFANENSRGSVVYVQECNSDHGSKLELISKASVEDNNVDISSSLVSITVEKFGFENDDAPYVHTRHQVAGNDVPGGRRKMSHGRECNGLLKKDLLCNSESSAAQRLSNADVLKGWHMTSIETSYSDSGEDEFFDAQGTSTTSRLCYNQSLASFLFCVCVCGM